ncbi:MAG: hypothetical protein VX694_14820 [Planctomycetota bacterium]|nr:hypothetical protein [Planctomycetota bacterium]
MQVNGFTMKHLTHIADQFTEAFYTRSWPEGSRYDFDRLSAQEAYQVQSLVTQAKINRGERVAGYKVGCTSTAIQKQFGLNAPILAPIFQPRIYSTNAHFMLRDFVDCAIEPEMVIKIGRTLFGKSLSDEELLNGITSVSPGIELHHYRFWRQPPCLSELICSGGIHAGLVVGGVEASPRSLNFESERFSVYLDDRLEAEALALEIMGGPLESLRWLVSELSEQDKALEAGALVIPGSPTPLIPIPLKERCQLRVEIHHVGSVSCTFSP